MKKNILFLAFIFFFPGFSFATDTDQLTLMQEEIKHVVIVMLENRSFDNIAAWVYDENNSPSQFIPEYTDPHYLGLSESTLDQYTNHLKNSKGEIIFSSPPIKGIPSTSSTPFLNSPKFGPHEPFPNVQIQIFGDAISTQPTMLGFLQDYASIWTEDDWQDEKKEICAVMETYTDKELPIFHSLARHYAISDYWFSSVPTQTNPNRAFVFCGTSQGEVSNGPFAKNLFTSDTIWNRINEKLPETTWSIFWQSDMLPGIYSGPYSGTNTFERLNHIPNINDHFLKIDTFHELATKGNLPDISFIEPQWTLSYNLSFREKKRFENLLQGRNFILGLQGNDFHPPGDMRTGENFLANIYTSLISNQEAWSKTLLIITFDEHGGLFDHIPPPKAIGSDDDCQHGFLFDRYGVRIPTLLISPKINKGVVLRSEDQSLPFDHTSLIAMLLKWKNLDKNDWNLGKRVNIAPTFESIFTRSDVRQDPLLIDKEQIKELENDKNTLKRGDRFFLKDNNGHYLCDEDWKFWNKFIPFLSKKNLILEFDGGTGDLMHGSFTLIKSTDLEDSESYILHSSLDDFYCFFGTTSHSPNEWWTIKSVDHPIVGRKIKNGDKIYLENHTYCDLTKYVPCRLTRKGSFHSSALKTEPIIEEGSDQLYWIIEKL